jgi:hypothetical protein
MGLIEPRGDVHDDAVTFVVTAPADRARSAGRLTHLPGTSCRYSR